MALWWLKEKGPGQGQVSAPCEVSLGTPLGPLAGSWFVWEAGRGGIVQDT